MADTINDVMYTALKDAGFDDNVTAMLLNWQRSLDINGWTAYVEHVMANTTAEHFADAEYEFWVNYTGEEPPSFTPADLSPALWIDPSDASTVTISGSSGAYIGAAGLVLSGSGVNYASVPNHAGLAVTGDIDIIAKITPVDWTPVSKQAILWRAGGSGATDCYGLELLASGALILVWANAASSYGTATSTVATGLSDGSTKWVRATLDVNNGSSNHDVKFYLSDDGSTWTQLGTTITNSGVTDIKSGSVDLRVGSYMAVNPFNGTIHRAIVKNGIDGTAVFDADFESATPYVSAFTESALGAPVYVVSSTATSATANYSYIGPEGYVGGQPTGTAEHASVPASTAYDTEDFELVARLSLRNWNPGDYRCIYTHGNSLFDANQRLGVRVTDRTLQFDWYDGTTFKYISATTSFPAANGETVWIKVTFDYNAGGTYAANFYYAADQATEPSSWTQIGSTVSAAQASGTRPTNKPIYIRADATYTARQFDGTIKRVIVRNAIGGTTIFDADFTTAPDYAASFTESSSNAATVTITATNTPANAAGALVSQINDKSGNARHLTQGTAANMPKYWNGRNGNNCLVFDGSNDFVTGADWTGLSQNGFTAAYVRVNDTAASKVIANYAADRYPMWSSASELLASYIVAGGVTSVGTMNRVIGSSCMTDASASAGRAWLDGTLTTGTTNSAVTGGTLTLGHSGASTLWFSGELGTFFICTSIPTSDQITDTHDYIKAAWGTP